MTADTDHRVAVLLHLSTLRHWDDFRRALDRLDVPFDLFVNLVSGLNDSDALRRQRELIAGICHDARVIVSENRGMDVGGMFRLFDLARRSRHRALLYAHSKSDDAWRRAMLDTLTGNSAQAIRLLTRGDDRQRSVGMVGAYQYPFDYYNIGPFMSLARELGLQIETTWQRYFRRYPAAQQLPIDQRVAHALATGRTDLRPEIDLDYARQVLGDIDAATQPVTRARLGRMIADRVVGPLPYFPGNCFWISAAVVDRLANLVDFQQEFRQLPADLASDCKEQSRAHAWERMLPVFALKSGFALASLASRGGRRRNRRGAM